MNTTSAKLGIKPEHRDKIMYCPQYPISAEKRIHMISFTLINEKNGFWYEIPRSHHSCQIRWTTVTFWQIFDVTDKIGQDRN